VTVTAVVSDQPTRARSMLRSRSAIRPLPHQSAARAAERTTRNTARSGRTNAEPVAASAAPTASAGQVQRTTSDAASPSTAAAADEGGEVHEREVGLPGRAAGSRDRVGDAASLREAIQARAAYRPHDVDDDARRRRSRGGDRRRWERRRGRRRAPTVGEEAAA